MSDRSKTSNTMPSVKTARIGESATGSKYIEFCIHLDRDHSQFISVRDLNQNGGTPIIDWLTNVDIPVIGTAEASMIEAKLGEKARQALLDNRGEKPVLIVDQLGWNGPAFATKYKVHSPKTLPATAAGSLKFIDQSHLKTKSIRKFRKFARRYGKQNDLVKFMLCTAFVGPLLPLMDTELFWLFLVGKQGRGKSSLLNVAASIFGGQVRGRIRLLETMSSTDNAAEAVSLKSRHLLVGFDDTSALSSNKKQRAAILENVVMRTVQALEKARLNEDQRIVESLFAAASNRSVRQIFEDGDISYGDYTAVRAIELIVDYRHGILERVPVGMRPSDFVKSMVREALAIRGLAGEVFSRRLVEARHADENALKNHLDEWRQELVRRLDPKGDDSDLVRVAEHFAGIYAAGCLAGELGVLPWTQKQIRRAILRVYDKHIQSRADAPTLQAEVRLHRFIRANRQGLIKVREGSKLPSHRKLVTSRGARYRRKDGLLEYCFTEGQLQRALGKQDIKKAMKRLLEYDLLKRDGTLEKGLKNKCKRRICRNTRPRVYVIDPVRLRSAAGA